MAIPLLRAGNLQDVLEEDNKIPPMDYIIRKIEKIKADDNAPNILIVKSEPGSGKSTTIPPKVFLHFGEKVACTQPRVLTAMKIPEDVIPYYKMLKMGENIGYKTGARSRESKGINYMTLGVIVQYALFMEPEEFFTLYPFILIDEAHERNIEMDILLLVIKQYAEKYKKKIPFFIFMSGTINVEKFLAFFNLSTFHQVKVSGFTFPIKDVYTEQDIPNYIQGAFDIVFDIIKHDPVQKRGDSHDILVFCPTNGDITKLYNLLKARIDKEGLPVMPIQINREVVSQEKQDFVSVDLPISILTYNDIPVERRVVISTNVAETGLTLATLKHVIDTGFFMSAELNPNYGVDVMVTKPVTTFSARQRRGRVGRKFPGIAYSVFTRETYNELQIEKLSDFVASKDSVAGFLKTMLYVDPKSINYNTTEKFIDIGLMDPLPKELIIYIKDKLYALGFMQGDTVTALGQIAIKISKIPIEAIRMIMCGYAFDICVADLITIAVGLEQRIEPFTSIEISDQFLEVLFTVEEWSKNLVYKREFKELIETRNEIMNGFSQLGLSPFNAPSILNYFPDRMNVHFAQEIINNKVADDVLTRFKRCVYEGFKLNLLKKHVSNGEVSYKTLKGYNAVVADMYSKQQNKFYIKHGFGKVDLPNYIVAHKLVLKKSPMSPVYKIHASIISVMDGFVGIDDTFFEEIPNRNVCEPVSDTNFKAYYNLLPIGKKVYDRTMFENIGPRDEAGDVNPLTRGKIGGDDKEIVLVAQNPDLSEDQKNELYLYTGGLEYDNNYDSDYDSIYGSDTDL